MLRCVKLIPITILVLVIALNTGCSKKGNIKIDTGFTYGSDEEIESFEYVNEVDPEVYEVGINGIGEQNLPDGYTSYLLYWEQCRGNKSEFGKAPYEYSKKLTRVDEILSLLDKALYNLLIQNVYYKVDIGDGIYNLLLTNSKGEQFRQEFDESLNVSSVEIVTNEYDVYTYEARTGDLSKRKDAEELGYIVYPALYAIAHNKLTSAEYSGDYRTVDIVIDYNGFDEIEKVFRYLEEDVRNEIMGYIKMSSNFYINEADDAEYNMRFEYIVGENGVVSIYTYVYFGEPIHTSDEDWSKCYTYYMIDDYWIVDDWKYDEDVYRFKETDNIQLILRYFEVINNNLSIMLNKYFNEVYETGS